MFCLAVVIVREEKTVRLTCQKPSNLATLTWTSPRFKTLSQESFIQSADGSLSFFPTTATFGTYRCEAEEGGYKELIAIYQVQQFAPRGFSPPQTDKHPVSNDKDVSYEKIETTEPVTSTTETSRDPENYTVKDGDEFMTNLKDVTHSNKEDSGLKNFPDDDLVNPTSRKDSHFGKEPLNGTQKDYYSELVVVSLLLATCICFLMLGGLHMWRQRNTGLIMNPLGSPDGSKTDQSMESVPSLSSPEDPEVKVME